MTLKPCYVLLALFVAGCVSAGPTEAEKDEAFRALYACIGRNVTALDDGRSDATTVATGIFSACRMETLQIRATYKAVDPNVIDRSTLQSMTKAVLHSRSKSARPQS